MKQALEVLDRLGTLVMLPVVAVFAVVYEFFWWLVGCGILFIVGHFVVKNW